MGDNLDLIGERSRCEAARNRSSASVKSKLEDGALSVRPCRDDAHVGRVLNRCYCSCCKQQLLPRPLQVYDVGTCNSRIIIITLIL